MQESDILFNNIISSVFKTILNIWNYTIYTTTDRQPITLANMIFGIILFILGLKLARYLSNLIRLRILNILKLDPTVRDSLEKISHYLFIIFITLIVLDISHVPLTIFTFVGGALAISIGLGSQNILNNFISGLIIMVEQPIRVGDIVEVNNNIGEIITIGARCVHLKTASNIDILVPNSLMLQNTVINWTLVDDNIRSSIQLFVDSENSQLIQEILIQAMIIVEGVLSDPKPRAYFLGWEIGALKFELQFWIHLKSEPDRREIISNVN
ncbi:MAG: mechanosensitive ion channel, partial [Rickettsiales bacterium]